MDRALHETVALQTAQRLRQHFLRDSTDLALEGGVTHRPARENLDNERSPFIRNPIEHKPGRALRIHHRSGRSSFSHISA